MNLFIGLFIGAGSLIGGFLAEGGRLGVLMQPFEFLIIGGIAFGVFVMGNPLSALKDAISGVIEAITGRVPKRKDFLALLSLLFALMRDLRTRPKAEVEAHVDDPENSPLFTHFPGLLKDKELTHFVCDYVRLIIIGNARSHEIEALMEQEITTLRKAKTKVCSSLSTISEALPALGICAAVLGIVKAMGALSESPEILGEYIGAALIGTLTGIFWSYAVVSPLAQLIKSTREKQVQPYFIVKQSLIAFMNGALPQIALEHGRKAISASERPTIDEVESDAISNTPKAGAVPQKQAA
ncbi:MAG TPA: flagellar motor stator protein MotA [Bauldia sp.]|nr:flagellar motor stator protein MotA [Bauldia sp.]